MGLPFLGVTSVMEFEGVKMTECRVLPLPSCGTKKKDVMALLSKTKISFFKLRFVSNLEKILT